GQPGRAGRVRIDCRLRGERRGRPGGNDMVTLVAGHAQGPVLYLDEPLSFWGGVDITSGTIIDSHHPQAGQSVTGKVLVLPHARGSSSTSSVIAEMIRARTAPAAVVLRSRDPVIVLGAVVARELYGWVLP